MEIIPGFSNCQRGVVGAFDPPSALTAETALAPPISPGKPNARPLASAPSSTIDSGDRQTVGVDASIPVPAGIPALDQPKATSNVASAPPTEEAPGLGPQLNDPATQKISPSQALSNAVEPSSDPNGDNDPQGGSPPKQASGPNQGSGPKQDSDPKQGIDPTQGSSSDIDSGKGAGAKPNGDLKQGDSNQGSNQIPDSGPQNNPKQIDTNPFDVSTEGQARTINNQVVQPLSRDISIAGTTLTPGAPGTTLDGTLLSLDTASHLVVGSKTIPLSSASSNPITTIIAGQIITAASNKIAIAGTALTPGASGLTVSGTLISLNTAGQLIVGSKIIALQSGSTGLGGLIMEGLGVGAPSDVADSIITTIDGHVITAAPAAVAMAGTTLTPGAAGFTINGTLVSLNTAAQLVVGSTTIPLENGNAGSSGQTAEGNVSAGAGNGTSPGVQVFKGNAASLRGGSFWNRMAVSAVALSVLSYLY